MTGSMNSGAKGGRLPCARGRKSGVRGRWCAAAGCLAGAKRRRGPRTARNATTGKPGRQGREQRLQLVRRHGKRSIGLR